MPAVAMWGAGVAVTWTTGITLTSKSSAGLLLPGVGLPVTAIAGFSYTEKGERVQSRTIREVDR